MSARSPNSAPPRCGTGSPCPTPHPAMRWRSHAPCAARATWARAALPRTSRPRLMPLTRGQVAALKVIAAARDPESYVAGSIPLNRDHRRYSADIDIFQDREERVAQAAEADATSLATQGFAIR